MEKEIDEIISRHSFKEVSDIRLALEEAYRAGEIHGATGWEQAVWEAGSKMH